MRRMGIKGKARGLLLVAGTVIVSAAVVVGALGARQGPSGAAGTGRVLGPPAPDRTSPPLQKPGLEIVPTALVVRDGAAVKRIVHIVLELPGVDPVAASLEAFFDGRRVDAVPSAFVLQPGRNVVAVRLPEPAKPARADLRISSAEEGQSLGLARRIVISPARPWTVYLFHHSHTDIGYTELQPRVARNHVEYLDSVIKYCRETDDYPDAAKFRWNIEITWALENFVKSRPDADVRALVDLIKAGRVELSALYLQLSDCYAHEEMARTVDAARDLACRFGFEVRSAMNNDVNGFAWSLPQIFRQAGVRYFASGINETRSRAPLRRPNAFWWESPDGSRILHWNGEHYLFGNYELLLHESVDRSAPKVGEYLARLEARGDYPQDLIAFNVGAWTTDNCPPGRQISDRVKEWNERFVSPKMRLATMREFFEQMEKRYGASLPVHKLGWPDYWTDGVASTAFETGLNRIAHNEILTAEKVSAIAAALDPAGIFVFPRDEIRDGQTLSMLYDEHTWGAYNSISEPWSELARGQWAEKSRFAYEARETSRTLLRRGGEALARLIGAAGEHGFAVFNPLSWTRTDAVRVTLPAGPLREAKGRLRIVDRRTGEEAAFEPEGDEAVLVLAKDIPALGYAVFAVESADGPEAPRAASAEVPDGARGGTVENRFYRVTIDPKTGGISSLFDKEIGRELVDASAPWGLNAYVYEQPEGGRAAVDNMTKRAVFHRWTPESVTIEAVERGPVSTTLAVASAPKTCASLRQRIVLYNGIKRIDFVNEMDKIETFDPEAVYFAFPFLVGTAPPSARLEIAGADMAPGLEQLPGTTLDWQTVQHWVEFAGNDARVVWSPLEAPLVEFGDINTGKWQTEFATRNAWVFSYAMNNYWMTNFKASQEGRVQFRYSLTSALPGAGPDRVSSSRFGWEVHTPLVAIRLAPGSGRSGRPAGESFLSTDAPNVVVQALWLDKDGVPVARLREIAGRAVEGRLSGAILGGATVRFALRPFEMRAITLAK